jgi:hypothetical protein
MARRLALTIIMAALAAHGEILDRIAVTVGKQVISESDVILDLRVSAFLDEKPVDLSGAEKRKAAGRLVDQLLILQDAAEARVPLPSAGEAAPLLAQVKVKYGTEAAYREALTSYHISAEELADHLLAGLRAMRFTDLRFRPEIQLSEDDLREFYNTLAEPAPARTFEESRAQVEKLLTEQRVLEALDRWLGMARTEIRILYREQVFK